MLFRSIGYNLNSGSEEALVYDSMKLSGQESGYMKVNSRLNLIIEIAQGIATVIGGIIAEYSFPVCYIISVMIAMIALIPAVLFVEPDELKEEENITVGIKEHFKICVQIIRSNPILRKILLYYPMVFTFYTIVFFYGQEYFRLLGMNKIEISIIMLLASIMSCLGAISSEMFLSKFGNRAKYLSSLLMGMGIIMLGKNNLIVSVIAFAIITYANAVLYPIQSKSINELIPSKQRATIISVDSMIFSMMMIVLFPLCGIIADFSSLHLVFMALGILQLLIMLVIQDRKSVV